MDRSGEHSASSRLVFISPSLCYQDPMLLTLNIDQGNGSQDGTPPLLLLSGAVPFAPCPFFSSQTSGSGSSTPLAHGFESVKRNVSQID